MHLQIFYRGDLGKGEVNLEIKEDASIAEMIQQFHIAIDSPETYTISAGRPPKRRSIEVDYNYRINSRDIEKENYPDLLSDWEIKDGTRISLIIGGAGKVD